jgi:hypothetical protein
MIRDYAKRWGYSRKRAKALTGSVIVGIDKQCQCQFSFQKNSLLMDNGQLRTATLADPTLADETVWS